MSKQKNKKLTSNKNTLIEYVNDKASLDKLRQMYQKTSPEAHSKAKSVIEKCFFCKEVIDDTNKNDSHLIPKSFLAHISENKRVSTIDSMSSLETRDPANFFNSEIAHKSALTFFGVCGNCDGPEFSEYENNPLSDLTQGKMREIAIKTLLAFRYVNLHKFWQASLLIELVKEAIHNDLRNKYSSAAIDQYLMNDKAILRHISICNGAAKSVLIGIAEAENAKDYRISFSKVLDFEIKDNPIFAMQSFFIHGDATFFVNIFPVNSGSRVIIFKTEKQEQSKDDRFVLSLSVMELIASSMVFFRKSLAITPTASSKFIDGDSVFHLLGPRSLTFTNHDDLRKISMKALQTELLLRDSRMFKRLHEFL